MHVVQGHPGKQPLAEGEYPVEIIVNLTIIMLTMWPCVWQPTDRTADVTVTKIAGYVRVRILMNQ